MANPPHCARHHGKWIVRIIIRPDARQVLEQSVFRVTTRTSDKRLAVERAHAIVAALKCRIEEARTTLQQSEKNEAVKLAARFRELHGVDADRFVLEDVLEFVLKQGGHSLTDYGRRLRASGGIVDDALDDRTREWLEVITGHTTPFLAYVEDSAPHSGLKPRSHDQAVSSLRTFDKEVNQPIERLEAKHVQQWIDETIKTNKAAKVARKVGEIRSYWRYLQSRQIVPEDRDPFANRRIKDPPARRESRDQQRQKWTPAEVRNLMDATAESDPPLHASIVIVAYSGARSKGLAQLRVSDIRYDPQSRVHFMHMADKTAAGDRDLPIHPDLKPFLETLVGSGDTDGYLIRSNAKNKYGERSQLIGKRFGRLKTRLGFDGRYVFHSIRKTVTSMMQDAGVREEVAADFVGHVNQSMTYGLYGGVTEMGLRAKELARSVSYPSSDRKGESSTAVTI